MPTKPVVEGLFFHFDRFDTFSYAYKRDNFVYFDRNDSQKSVKISLRVTELLGQWFLLNPAIVI